MIKKTRAAMLGALFFLLFQMGCQSAALEKTTKPVVAPIRKTTQTVFRERKIGSEDSTQAVIFPKDEETERKQFKLRF